jgi:hypothetical protein
VSKYGNTRTRGYDSKREANRARDLQLLENAGEITELRFQVAFELAPAVVIGGRKKPALRYFADFVYRDKEYKLNGGLVVEDCKGFRTAEYKIKKHLMKSVHNLDIFET